MKQMLEREQEAETALRLLVRNFFFLLAIFFFFWSFEVENNETRTWKFSRHSYLRKEVNSNPSNILRTSRNLS